MRTSHFGQGQAWKLSLCGAYFPFWEQGDNSWLGSTGKSRKSCMDQLCSAREEHSAPLQSLQELQRRQEPWAEQQAAGDGWCLQGGHSRVGERQRGLGELHRRGQEHPEAAAGIRRKGRVGGCQWRAKLATHQRVEATLQWKKTIRRKEVRPPPPPPAQEAAWAPTPQ